MERILKIIFMREWDKRLMKKKQQRMDSYISRNKEN